MYTVAEIILLARIYLAAIDVSPARLSIAATGNPKTIPRLLEGEDCSGYNLERASIWFTGNWPINADWPADVPRAAGRWRLEVRRHGPPLRPIKARRRLTAPGSIGGELAQAG